MRSRGFVLALLFGFIVAFETPPAPLPIYQSSEYGHYDIQVHNRDNPQQWESAMAAQHGSACQGPPATHSVSALSDSVFICNGHVMTSANGSGYGLVVITPSQLLDCTVSCSVQWEMSTERQSTRDWPDVWLTPWADNLTLPFNAGDVDLQGVPRSGLHIDLNNAQGHFVVSTISNYDEITHGTATEAFNAGIAGGTNQAAVRQTFRASVVGGSQFRLERVASATATAALYIDTTINPLGSDLVVQFAHHSYNPSKDGAGQPATWHWNNFQLNPSVPFTLIHAAPTLAQSNNTLINFAPAPANAYLRFSAACRVSIDGVLAPKQRFIGHPEHASSYFMPIAQGKQSVTVSFSADDWYGPGVGIGCYAQDFAVWAKGGAVSTPTPTPSAPTPTATQAPTATSTPAPLPTATATPVPPTATPPPSTATPTPSVCRIPVQQPNGTFANRNGTLQPFGTGLVCVVP